MLGATDGEELEKAQEYRKEDDKIKRGKAFQLNPKPPKSSNRSTNNQYREAVSTPEDIDQFRLAPADQSSAGLWEQAWERVKTGEDDWKSWPQFQGVKDLKTKSVVREVHGFAQKRRDEADRNQRHVLGTSLTYRRVCSKVAKCAKKFEVVGDLVAQGEPIYAALPWTFLRFVIECTVGESEMWDSMLAETEIVATHITKYPVIEQLYAKLSSKLSQELRDSLLNFYTLMLRFQVHVIKYFDPARKGSRNVEGMNPVTADRNQKEMQAIEEARQRVDNNILLVDAEVTKLGIDNLKEGQEGQRGQLLAVKDGIKALSQDLEGSFSEAEQHQQDRHRDLVDLWKGPLEEMKSNAERERNQMELNYSSSVRTWLSEASPWEDHDRAKIQRKMVLGQWLIDEPNYKSWHTSTQSSILWVYGFAGTGKTGLVCRVIEALSQECNTETDLLAIFYCSSDKARTGRGEKFSTADPEEALRSIVSQVTTSGRNVASIVAERYDTFGPNGDRPKTLDYLDCVDILVDISRTATITIVLDAFDECDQAESPTLLKYLEEIIRQSPRNIKVFISTRPFPAIEKHLSAGEAIEVTKERNGRDVHDFIETTLGDRIGNVNFSEGENGPKLRQHIVDTLTIRAGNMFLYASLLLRQLCDENHTIDEDSIKKKLDELPKNLTEIYTRIMVEIHDEKSNSVRSCRLAQNTIKWLLSAQKPLDHQSLLEAISPSERRADLDEVLRACRTLVVSEGERIAFAHYSVREHVLQMDAYSASQCNIVATRNCLRILETYFGADEANRSRFSEPQVSFKDYALLYWPLHYEGIAQGDLRDHRAAINSLLRSLFLKDRGDRHTYADWFRIALKMVEPLTDDKYLASKLSALRANPPTPLFAACVFGLEDLIGKFGRELDGLNKYNEDGQNALCLAIENNKLEAVKALLSGRFPADLNSLNVQAVQQMVEWDDAKPPKVILYASALQCAAATGRVEIGQFLIEEGAHVDLVAGYFGSPLQAACLRGHAAIVQLLLKHRAEPNSQGGFHGNALQAAAAGGHSEIIDLLLENKPPAFVDSPGGYYGFALMAAVCSGNSDAVFAILEEKAEPSVKRRIKKYGTPLEQAVRMGRESRDIVDILVDFQATADLSPSGNGVHIFHRAAMYGMNGLVKYCFAEGCKIDMITTEGPDYNKKARFNWFPRHMTPLAYACAEGHLDVVTTLLEHGAPFEENMPHSAPLWVAAYQGHAKIIEILITRFKEKHTEEETLAFMDHLPDPDAGRHFLLFTAATAGSRDAVKCLLDHRVPYRSNWFGATPLQATVTFGHSAITRLLLEYHEKGEVNVHLDQRTGNGKTSLYDACQRNNSEIVSLLLDAGANVFIGHNEGGTTLYEVCHHENYRLVQKIVEKARQSVNSDEEFLQFLNTRHGPTGNTALMVCAVRNRLSFLNLLLQNGADPLLRNKGDETILHCACRLDNIDLVRTIVDNVRQRTDYVGFLGFINHQPNSHKTALVECAENGRLDALNLLLGYRADYTLHGHFSNTPLLWASIKGHYNIVARLIQHAKDPDKACCPYEDFVNHRNNDNKNALFEASKGNYRRIVELLLEEGIDWSVVNKANETAVHAATWPGHREVVSALLTKAHSASQEDFKKFLDCRNIQGKSPLIDASIRGWTNIFKQMVESFGADYLFLDSNRSSTLHLSCWEGHAEIVKFLLTYASTHLPQERLMTFLNHRNKWGATALSDAAHRGRTDSLSLLLEPPYSADYRLGNENGVNALHRATTNAQKDAVSLLLKFARDNSSPEEFQKFINARNRWAKTPLMDAAEHNRMNIAGYLLDYKADYSIVDNDGSTALHWCAFRNHMATVRVLLERTSQDPSDNGNKFKNFLDQQGHRNRATALRDAVLQRHTDVAKYILRYNPTYDIIDSGKRTALHQALGTSNGDLANAIVEYANKDPDRERFRKFVFAKDENGDTAWNGANWRKMWVLVERMRATGVIEEG
ncbi:superkiller [Lecanora helva]